MNYQKSGIVFFKIENNKKYFLLAKDNFKLLNNNNNKYADIGGSKGKNDFNPKDTASRLFYENTLGLSYPISILKEKINDISYTNLKYKHIIYFVKENIDENTIKNINTVRSYLNTTTENINNCLNKIESPLQGCQTNNELKWFEINEIINNADQFDNQFMNTFLKSIKSNVLHS